MKLLIRSTGINIYILFIILQNIISFAEGGFNRCFKCRSRGELGSCKDNFIYNNASALNDVQGVEAPPCTSGWCGKILDRGSNTFKDEEYGAATERLCLQRGPDDNEERCALTTWGPDKVFMCFCQGDLCNNSVSLKCSLFISIFIPLIKAII